MLEKFSSKRCLDWHTRQALASNVLVQIYFDKLAVCIQELLFVDSIQSGEHSIFFLGLLSDPDYRVRVQMSHSVSALFDIFESHKNLFQSIYEQLPLGKPHICT